MNNNLKYLSFKILFFSFLLLGLIGCSHGSKDINKESCDQFRQMEASAIDSRNTINAMNEEHSSDATKSALDNADDALDILQARMIKECPLE
jgi:hypothetical protein